MISLIREISMLVTCLQGSRYALNEQLTKFLRPWFSQNRRQNFGTGAAEKHSFLSNYRFTIFMNKVHVIRSDTIQYIANIVTLGIDVIILGVAQQRKPKFLLAWEFHSELPLAICRRKTFFQNADSRFLMNTIIRSILNFSNKLQT